MKNDYKIHYLIFEMPVALKKDIARIAKQSDMTMSQLMRRAAIQYVKQFEANKNEKQKLEIE